MIDSILNREDFSWSKEQDPLWSSYKKEYLREGERASANALAQASAASGGRPSSYAATAASQAGDYYAAKLSDSIPTLYQQAYERYLNEYNMKLSDLGAVNQQEQIDYAKYLDQLGQYNTDRNFALDSWQSQQNQLLNQLGAVNSQEQLDYAKYLDQLGQYNTDRNFAYKTWQGDFDLLTGKLDSLSGQNTADQNWYLKLLDQIQQQEQTQYERNLDGASVLAAAGRYSGYAALWGFTPEETQALVEKYAKEQGISDQKAAIEIAEKMAEIGDTSGYKNLGWDTSYQDAVNAANLKTLQGQADAYNQKGGGYSSGSSDSSGGKMTLTTAKQAASAGAFNDEVLSVLRANGYTDDMLEAIYGYAPAGNGGGAPETLSTGGGANAILFASMPGAVNGLLGAGRTDEALSYLDRIWGTLSTAQKQTMQKLLGNYGYQYEEG